MKNNLKLVSFQATDGLILPGLLYEPEEKTDKALIYLHGNGTASVFYSPEKMNLYAEELNKIGITFFPFNNRGAHYIKKLDKKTAETEERIFYGMTYELIKECIFDIDGAINFLKGLGYKAFYLAGVSTGANKVVLYNSFKLNNPISKYILISGGDDLGLYYSFYFKNNRAKFFNILESCRTKIKAGKGREFVPMNIIPEPLISYQSLYDTLNPDGDYNIFPFLEYMKDLNLGKKKLFKEYGSINKKTLVTYGELDEYCHGDVAECVDILKKEATNLDLFTYKIIKGADHGYHGKEKELIKIITDWLAN